MMETGYGFSVEVALPAEEADARVRELLREEGFGVLTEIDVSQTLAEKLGVEFRPVRRQNHRHAGATAPWSPLH